RFERTHVDSILGLAMLVLDQPEPGMGYVTQSKALEGILDGTIAASPRQQAMAMCLRSLLISRVALDAPQYSDDKFRNDLIKGSGITGDKDKDHAAAVTEESKAFGLDKNNPELFLIRGKRMFWEGNLSGAAAEIGKAI